MVICHRLNMNYLKRKCPVGVDQNNLITQSKKGSFDLGNSASIGCKVRAQCTQSKTEPRKIRRWIHEAYVDSKQD